MIRWQLRTIFSTSVVCLLASAVQVGAASGPQSQQVVSGLQEPVAIAIRPDAGAPYEVYVADRGAGQVIKFDTGKRNSNTAAITKFPSGGGVAASKQSAEGLSALFFLDQSRLVTGGAASGQPFLWLFDLSADDNAIDAGDRKQEATIPAEVRDRPAGFSAFVRTKPNDRVPDRLFVSGTSSNQQLSLFKVGIRANTLEESAQPVAVQGGSQLGNITAIAASREGYLIAACEYGSGSDNGCRLCFLSPLDGSLLSQIATKLPHVSALAYSPTTGNLYAANPGSVENGGGIYRLDDTSEPGEPACSATRIVELAQPSAMAFAPNGALYITVLGGTNGTPASGAVQELTGEL
jgi:hypothetical protein